MNLLTLIGAAIADASFCELLFDDPVKAAQLLGFALTQGELLQLQQTFSEQDRDQICGQFSNTRTLICHHPPCNYAPVTGGDGSAQKRPAA